MTRSPFLSEDFLLQTEAARRLYHEYAEAMPILDYHCHLPVKEIAGDRRFANLTEIWLNGDHYKWRAMRAAGVDERFITGDATDWEKFVKWAETVPKTLRNPLYHWTHLELKRPFGISDRLLDPGTARGIWDECNAKLATPAFSARGIMKQMRVVLVCTTDDPTDSLEWHRALAADTSFDVTVLPAWRPDKVLAADDPAQWNLYVDRLGAAADVDIRSFDSLLEALQRRHDYFHANGCRLSDHGLENMPAADYTDRQVRSIFDKVRSGRAPGRDESLVLRSALLYEMAVMDAKRGWVQQFHLGAMRGVNSRMLSRLGPDTGYDAIGDFEQGRPLARFLDRLERNGLLAKTILYNLNPRDNELLAAICGCFQDGSAPGKMQFGAAWWFLDQKDGIERHLDALSSIGLLGTFVGMLTDSRSFLSYARHEYFRRILCNVLGREMTDGLLPDDMSLVGELVKDICYRNAARYFGFAVPPAG